jgi:hypothetical protein
MNSIDSFCSFFYFVDVERIVCIQFVDTLGFVGDTGKIRQYGSGPSMMPHIYGYRLGTKEEVDVFKKF